MDLFQKIFGGAEAAGEKPAASEPVEPAEASAAKTSVADRPEEIQSSQEKTQDLGFRAALEGVVLEGGHLLVQIFELFVLNVWGAKTFKRSFDHQDVFKP